MVQHRKATNKTSEPSQNIQIPEDEQWRLINETGILKEAIPKPSTPTIEEETSLADEIFGAVTLIIPFSFLLLMFDMCVFSLIR